MINVLVSVPTVAIVCGLWTCAPGAEAPPERSPRDRTVIEAAPSWPVPMAAKRWPVSITRSPMTLSPATDGTPVRELVSAVSAVPEGGFQHLIASVNADVPEDVSNGDGAWLTLEVRVGDEQGWTPFLRLMRWGPGTPPDAPVTKAELAGGPRGARVEPAKRVKVDIDALDSTGPLSRWQYRVRVGGPGAERASVQAVAVTTSREQAVENAAKSDSSPDARETAAHAGWRLGVPFRSQKTPDAALSGRLCSPTSVSMVLAFRQRPHPVADVAKIARDPDEDIYGNWPRNVMTAWTLGVPGFLTRIGSWNEARAYLETGQPIIASIAVEPGELPAAPYKSTAGHLIVLAGLTPSGDVYVNDPACADARSGLRIYPRDGLTNVWLNATRGTAYVLMPASSEPATKESR